MTGSNSLSSAWPSAQTGCMRSFRRGATLCWGVCLTFGAAAILLAGAVGQAPDSRVLYAVLLGCAVGQAVAGLIVLVLPTRAALVAASLVNVAGLFVWIVVHTSGVLIGTTMWRPETLGIPDFYLPAMQLLASLLFATVWVKRTRVGPPVLAALMVALLAASYMRNPG